MVNSLAAMIVDPCAGPVSTGLFGSQEGPMSRMKRTFTLNLFDQSTTSGYLLWAPALSSHNIPNEGANCFGFQAFSGDAVPTNSVAAPAYNATLFYDQAGGLFKDPAHQFADEKIVRDMRTTAACMGIQYFGNLADSQGEIGFITGISATELIDPDTGLMTISANGLFDYASRVGRLGAELNEVKYAPNDGQFYNQDASVLKIGVQGVNTTVASEESKNANPTLIGFCWRNIGATQNTTVTMTKVLEWRPALAYGMTHRDPVVYAPTSLASAAVAVADARKPGWKASVGEIAQGLAGGLKKIIADDGIKIASAIANAVYAPSTASFSPLRALPRLN